VIDHASEAPRPRGTTIKLKLILTAGLAGLVVSLLGAAPAQAAPPPNDTFAGARVISSLPFSDALDTTQATTDQTDEQVASGCGVGGALSTSSTSVWYAFTPSTDESVNIDAGGSSYFIGLGVVTGAPGSFTTVQCSLSSTTSFVARSGETYYLDVVGPFGGGALMLSVTGVPEPGLDQSFTSPGNSDSVINDCCNFVAQTFTAGRDGVLTGVSIDTFDTNVQPFPTTAPLRVSIRNTENGLPGPTVLATTVLDSQAVPLSQRITFPQKPRIHSGVQYAIVLNLESPQPNDQAGWIGADGNAYPRGNACASFNDGVNWFCYAPPSQPQIDNHFQTFVSRTPTSTSQCKNSGWRNFPQFKNEGLCIAFVIHNP
jgi:hypothetical protein